MIQVLIKSMTKNSSAAKRVHIALRNNKRNKNYKSSIRTIIKRIAEAKMLNITKRSAKFSEAQLLISQAYSKIDKAVKKGVIHKNMAARKKSRLANMLIDC